MKLRHFWMTGALIAAFATWVVAQNPFPKNFTGSLGGDVTGTQSATTVGKINGAALSGLATGLLKNTTGTGVPTIAVAGTDFLAPSTTTVPQWKTSTVLYVANGVSGCANANGCWLSTLTDGTTAITNAAAATAQNIPLTPNITKLWVASVVGWNTTQCVNGGTGLNIHFLGNNEQGGAFGTPSFSLLGVPSSTTIFQVMSSPVQATGTLATDSVHAQLSVATGTMDQTTAGCAFTVDMLMSAYQ